MNDRFSRRLSLFTWRRILLGLFFPLLFASFPSANAYSILTHEQVIDAAWTSIIVPTLLSRFPSLTFEQLRKAYAYAYGGCAIQDLGYYPFGNAFFSDLTHYVRSGDFVLSLFRNAHTANELAFAIGALSHYLGDTIGHSQAVNPSVAAGFPKLRAKYGVSVNYAQAKHAHVQTEFAFDVNQVAKQHMAPSAYLHVIGIEVPRAQMAAAFYETYGLNIRDILGLYHPAVRTYRFGVRSFLPSFAYAEALLHRRQFVPDTPGPELTLYEQHVAQLSQEAGWDHYVKGPGIGTYLLAGFIVILPKIGPAAMLAIKNPTTETEKFYIESVNRCATALHQTLERLAAPAPVYNSAVRPALHDHALPMAPSQMLPADLVPNRDLDTGARVRPGGYPLTDNTYAELLAKVTSDQTKPVPAGLKQDILSYYADPDAITTRQNRKKWSQVQKQFQILTTVPTRAEPQD